MHSKKEYWKKLNVVVKVGMDSLLNKNDTTIIILLQKYPDNYAMKSAAFKFI